MAAGANRCSRCGTGGQDRDGEVCYSCRCTEEYEKTRYDYITCSREDQKENQKKEADLVFNNEVQIEVEKVYETRWDCINMCR